MKTCKLCLLDVDYLEKHHIIPKSKGGLDNENNLISICLTCHSKIHNVSFQDSSGLISQGLKKSQELLSEDIDWCNKNSLLVALKFKKITIEELQFMNYLMLNTENNFDASKLKKYTLNQKIKITITL